MYDIVELNTKSLVQLKEIAKSLKLTKLEGLKKQEIVVRILDAQTSGATAEVSAKEDTGAKV